MNTGIKTSQKKQPESHAITGAYGFCLAAAGERLQRCQLRELTPGADEALIEVAGCGICHTDIGFAYGGVPTRHPLPLILGHEIAGRVVSAGERAAEWIGRSVIVPAVIPCHQCPACAAGRFTICRDQYMPGNNGDGGFATHVRVPARGLCRVPEEELRGIPLSALSVVADAVTTPYEAIRRSELGPEDVAVFTGVGGIGGFGVQIAAALGAAVAAIDVDPERLELAAAHGAALTLDARGMKDREIRDAVRSFARASGRQGIGLKIFETSGTPAGQATAFGLLEPGAHLAVVGYTPEAVQIRLSNLMAFDATARGNWGCPPHHYPAALRLVLEGKVVLGPYVEEHPLAEAAEWFEAAAHHQVHRRVILIPRPK